MKSIGQQCNALSVGIDQVNRWLVGVLMALLILNVWVAVLDRYVLKWQIGWIEELARYLMIWAILMAVPCCVVARQHVRLTMVFEKLPLVLQKPLGIAIDLITIAFFSYIAVSGTDFVIQGLGQLSTVFRMPMAYPFAAIPVAFGLAALQSVLAMVRDYAPESLTLSG